MLNGGVRFAWRHMHAFGEELEVMNQLFHVGLHRFAVGRCHLVVVGDDRAGIDLQPGDTLLDDAVRLPHFFHAHQVAVVAVAVDANGNIELHPVVNLVGLLPAQIPRHTRPAQHGTREAQRHRALRCDHADAHGALLPDPVVGQQFFVFVDALRKTSGEVFDEIQQRPLPVVVHPGHFARIAKLGRLVLRHLVRQVAVDATRPVIGGVHPRTRHRFVDVEEFLALAKRIEKGCHRADVERMAAEPKQVIEDARDFVEHRADVLRAYRHLETQQPLDGETVRVLVAHHRHVIEPIHVRQRLEVGLVLGEFFGAAMQEPDVRIRPLDYLAVELEHESQHAVRRGMLRAEVHRVVADFGHYFGPA